MMVIEEAFLTSYVNWLITTLSYVRRKSFQWAFPVNSVMTLMTQSVKCNWTIDYQEHSVAGTDKVGGLESLHENLHSWVWQTT